MATDTNSMPPTVIEVHNLSRRFGKTLALDDVRLSVPRGVVYGLVGENAAGKTTLIRHLMGLLIPETGAVRVLGSDPVKDPVGTLSRLGYLSEDRDLPEWMHVGEFLAYTKAFYPTWDTQYADSLSERFELDRAAKIKGLSQGQRAKLGLLAAIAHRPELLVLDEPSTGLDPIVRRDILEAIIRTVAEEGRTVFFSSHLLEEVERVSDHIAMMANGKVMLNGPIDELRESHHKLTVHFEELQSRPPAFAGALRTEGTGREWTIVCNGSLDAMRQQVTSANARIVEERQPSLDDLFVAYAGISRREAK